MLGYFVVVMAMDDLSYSLKYRTRSTLTGFVAPESIGNLRKTKIPKRGQDSL
jgi:hypothetical protein